MLSHPFIVSGGSIVFMRPWTEAVYGIPPEQVVGSSFKGEFEMRDGKAVVVRAAELDFVDDREGKPVAISLHIGHFDKGLDEALAKGWTVIDMKKDWKVIYPPQVSH